MGLKDKVVIVTGGASGIGAAISISLAAEGAVPVILTRSIPDPEFMLELKANSRKAVAIVTELTDDAQRRSAVDQAVSILGRIDGRSSGFSTVTTSRAYDGAMGFCRRWVYAFGPGTRGTVTRVAISCNKGQRHNYPAQRSL